jgi:carbamoyltransferase
MTASAFFPSPFEEAVVLTMDGVGEWTTTSVSIGRGNALEPVQEIRWPHSIGLLYSAFTYYTGFKVNSGEYKIMGLAPYGEPKYLDLIFTRSAVAILYRQLRDHLLSNANGIGPSATN